MTGRASLMTPVGMEPVLEHALARLGRSVGYDAARALAYDPLVMIPVSFAASDRLDWDKAVSTCWNRQAETPSRRGPCGHRQCKESAGNGEKTGALR